MSSPNYPGETEEEDRSWRLDSIGVDGVQHIDGLDVDNQDIAVETKNSKRSSLGRGALENKCGLSQIRSPKHLSSEQRWLPANV